MHVFLNPLCLILYVLTLWVAPPKMLYNGSGFNGPETNNGISTFRATTISRLSSLNCVEREIINEIYTFVGKLSQVCCLFKSS